MNATFMHAVGLVLVLGIMAGIRLMNSPRTAVKGNLLGASCMLGAVVLTLLGSGNFTLPLLWISLGAGALIGYILAMRTSMLAMPQLVALLNGLGGGASAFVAFVVLHDGSQTAGAAARAACALALVIGTVTLSGSLVAAGKLARFLPQRPVVLPRHSAINATTLVVLLSCAASLVVFAKQPAPALSVATLAVALLFGVVFTLRIGGADMPITISLLNSLSGVAASVAGFAVLNPLLVAVGAIVGAAGLILTQIMCRAMNRSLLDVLTGGAMAVAPQQRPANNVSDAPASEPEHNAVPTPPAHDRPDDKAASIHSILHGAKSVIIVPGYGMALAQAQSGVKRLLDVLENQGKDVTFAIHPVAGRMPGHMHVLLAEVDVPYEKLLEMDAVNDSFANTDLALVVGANDVVNPAASTAEGTPIYGMPILRVSEAKNVLVCNVDDRPGYAGVPNTLYQRPNVVLLLGDARDTLGTLIQELEKPPEG